MALICKSKKIEGDLAALPVENPRLYGLLHALSAFCEKAYDKDVILTSIHREGTGPHPEWRAADVRAKNDYWEIGQITGIKHYLKDHFPRSDQNALEASIQGWHGTLRHHGSGDNEHLHICVEPHEQFIAALGV